MLLIGMVVNIDNQKILFPIQKKELKLKDIEAVKEKRKSNSSKIALASTVVDSSKPIKTTKPVNPPNPSNDLKEIKPSIDNSLPLVDFGTESN